MSTTSGCLGTAYATIATRTTQARYEGYMEDPAILVTLLKTGLLLVMLIAAIAVGRELVPMARGRSMPQPVGKKDEKH